MTVYPLQRVLLVVLNLCSEQELFEFSVQIYAVKTKNWQEALPGSTKSCTEIDRWQ